MFIILFLHQTTTSFFTLFFNNCCLSSCSYIKPQPLSIRTILSYVVYHLVPTSNHNSRFAHEYDTLVVYHLVPTSNHNICLSSLNFILLFIILFLHQTTTILFSSFDFIRCLSSCSYIKPQPICADKFLLYVVYHLVPTSNHNIHLLVSFFFQLFIILFLHQTTTYLLVLTSLSSCLSSCSYIKPHLILILFFLPFCCLSSCSYIKPQHSFFHF